MLKRVALSIAVVAVVVGAVTPFAGAQSHKPKKHSVNVAITIVSVSQTGSPPVSGTSVDAGRATGTYGLSAVVQSVTYGTPAVGSFKATGTLFTRHGALNYTLTGSGKPNTDGSVSFTGSGKVAGGTDKFAGARGKFTFTGSTPSVSENPPRSFQVRGTVRY